jgi:hypothetical protein
MAVVLAALAVGTALAALAVTITGNGLATTHEVTEWVLDSHVEYGATDPEHTVEGVVGKYAMSRYGFPIAAVTKFSSGADFEASGYYHIEITASNTVGEVVTETRYLKVDGSDPEITIVETGLSETSTGASWVGSVHIDYTIQDPYSGIASQEALYGYSPTAFPAVSPEPLTDGTTFTTTGYYCFGISAEDHMGHTAAITRYAKIDSIPPTVTVTSDAQGMSSTEGGTTWDRESVTVEYEASDVGGSGLASVAGYYAVSMTGWPIASSASFASGAELSAQGYYRLEVVGIDGASNETHEIRFMKIDGQGPTVNIDGIGVGVTPETSAWQHIDIPVTVVVSDTLSGVDTESSDYGFDPWVVPAQSTTEYLSGHVFSEQGYYRFETTATDVAGNSTTMVKYLRMDRTPPGNPGWLSVDGATSGVWTRNVSNVARFGTVTDDFSGMDHYQLCTAPGVCFAASGTPYTFPVADGKWHMTVKGVDKAGNESLIPATFDYWLDTTGPVITPGVPSPIITDGGIELIWTAVDAVSGVLAQNIDYVHEESGTGGSATILGDEHNWTISPTQGDGEYTLSLVAYDHLWNEGTYEWTAIVDTAKPIYDSVTPLRDVSAIGLFTVTASFDDLAGIDSYQWRLMAGGPVSVTTGTTWVPQAYDQGSYTLQVKAVDVLGHETGWVNGSVLINDQTPPWLLLNSTGEQWQSRENMATWTWEAQDSLTEITEQEYEIYQGSQGLDGGSIYPSARSFVWDDPLEEEEGQFDFWLHVADEGENWSGWATCPFRYDGKAPVSSVTADVPEVWQNSRPSAFVQFDVTDGGSGVKWAKYCIGSGCTPYDELPDTTFEVFGEDSVEVPIILVMTDNVYNERTSTGYTLRYDITPPFGMAAVVGALDINGRKAISDTLLHINWSVADSAAGVQDQVLALWYDAEYQAECTTPPTCAFAPSSDGLYTASIASEDNAGNQNMQWFEDVVMRDTHAPIVNASLSGGIVIDGKRYYSRTVTMDWSAIDPDPGVGVATKEGRITSGGIVVRRATASPSQFDGFVDGVYMVTVSAADFLSNMASPSVLETFEYDHTAPSVEAAIEEMHVVLGGNVVTATAIHVDWSASADAVTKEARLWVGDSPIGTSVESPCLFSGLEQGEHMLEVVAVDHVGNVGRQTIEFTVIDSDDDRQHLYIPVIFHQ